MGCGSETYETIMDTIDLYAVPVSMMRSRERMLIADERDFIREYVYENNS